MFDAYNERLRSSRLMASLMDDPELAKESIILKAAEATFVNAADWRVLQAMGELFQMVESQGREHVLMSLLPIRLDLARKASDILGLAVEVQTIDELTWPPAMMQESWEISQMLRVGQFRTD